MPSKRSSNDLILFSSGDPRALVNWLCDNYGLSTILQSVAEYRPSGETTEAPTKRAYKKRRAKRGSAKKAGAKKAGKRGRRKGSRNKTSAETEQS